MLISTKPGEMINARNNLKCILKNGILIWIINNISASHEGLNLTEILLQTSKTKFYKHQPKKLSRFELSKKRKKGKKEKNHKISKN